MNMCMEMRIDRCIDLHDNILDKPAMVPLAAVMTNDHALDGTEARHVEAKFVGVAGAEDLLLIGDAEREYSAET